MNKILFIFIITSILFGCDVRYGFIEGKFKLADNSRLPKWFLGKGVSNDYKVFITIYSSLSGNNAKTCLHNKLDNNVIKCVVGTYRWSDLTKKEFEKKGTGAVYPNFSVITVDGVSEVFEQKEKNDILYISDSEIK